MIESILDISSRVKDFVERKRTKRKWRKLQDMGLRIGKDVYLPRETWIDTSHCYLISIGDRVRFGPKCAILAHDAFMNEALDSTKIGRVIIHESCIFGFGAIILPGVEIGAGSIIGANTVISTSVPPNSFVVGNPAKIIGKADRYIRYHRSLTKRLPLFPYDKYGAHLLPIDIREELLRKLGNKSNACGYITGGYSAMKKANKFFSGSVK